MSRTTIHLIPPYTLRGPKWTHFLSSSNTDLLLAISAFCLATSAAFWAALTAASTLSRIFPDLNVKILEELREPLDDATNILFLYLPSILFPAAEMK